MQLAVISDIHSNLEAFRAVLADIDELGIRRIVSLGDNIGYGPEPEAVLHIIRSRGIPSIMGNHELGIVEPSYLTWFNRAARRSLEINRHLLSPASLQYILTLQPHLIVSDCLCVHGFPPDSITTYLFEVSDAEIRAAFGEFSQELCFVGHTHDLKLIAFDGQNIRYGFLPEGTVELPEGFRYLINAGSVGQPRDGDNRAKYLVWDGANRRLQVRCVSYDIGRTAEGILRLGLPRINADRLW